MKDHYKTPGKHWRILAHGKKGKIILYSKASAKLSNKHTINDFHTIFDELVIDDWFHIEQMKKNEWWARIGDAYLWITIKDNDSDNRAIVDIMRGAYGGTRGTTETPARITRAGKD